MLWVDKYRPKSLDELTYHGGLSSMLKKIVKGGDFPHMLFYGPPGAGKHTRILALLEEVYGPGVHKVKIESRTFNATKSKKIEISTLGSAYHIEMNPQDAGIYDRVVVQDVIKEIASAHTLDCNAQKSFKIVFLKEVDQLTKTAQHGLRRTMEKYMKTCRIILCCESVSKVIDPLRSRCLAIRVAAPSHTEIVEVLGKVALEEGVTLPPELAKRIAVESGRNLRKALLMLETSFVTENNLSSTTELKAPAWEVYVDEVARLIIENQSPARLLKVRGKIYELLVNCIPPALILKELALKLVGKVDDELRYKLAHWAAHHERRMVQGSKPVVHIEAFVARVMQEYRTWALSLAL